MYNGNHTTMELRLAKDPEFKTVSGGLEVCKCNAAMSQGKRSEGKEPAWLSIEAWKYQAKCLSTLKKGDSVVISGSLKVEYWGDNNEKSKLVLTADSISKKIWAPKEPDQAPSGKANYQQQAQPNQAQPQHHFGQGINDQYNQEIPF